VGGVRLFVPDISYRWFLPSGGPFGDLRLQEIKHLALLLRHAGRLGRNADFRLYAVARANGCNKEAVSRYSYISIPEPLDTMALLA